MHELATIQRAVTNAIERLDDLGQPRVTGVDFVVGTGGHITEDALRQQFAICAAGTPLEQATLRIFWAPERYQCFDCLCQFTSVAPPEEARCPECGGIALEIDHDESCYIQSLEIEDQRAFG